MAYQNREGVGNTAYQNREGAPVSLGWWDEGDTTHPLSEPCAPIPTDHVLCTYCPRTVHLLCTCCAWLLCTYCAWLLCTYCAPTVHGYCARTAQGYCPPILHLLCMATVHLLLQRRQQLCQLADGGRISAAQQPRRAITRGGVPHAACLPTKGKGCVW